MVLWLLLLLLLGLVLAGSVFLARTPKSHKLDSNGDIVLLDLEKPVLPRVFQLANFVLAPWHKDTRIESEELLDEASRKTGLNDFGNEGLYPFRDGLDFFLQDYNSTHAVTPLGKISVKNMLTRLLVGRLKIMELVKQNPKILDEELLDPVFIAGPPRSGTTLLHGALAQGDLFRSLKFYEVYHPVIEPEVEEALARGQKDPRQESMEKDIDMLMWLRPFVQHLHEFGAAEPEEEVHLMAMTFQSVLFIALVPCPKYLYWEANFDRRPGYAFLELCLKVIQWQDAKLGLPRKPFLLKCPGHAACLPELWSVFPGARVIQTHRLPVQVLPSVASLLTYMYGVTCSEIDVNLVGRMCTDLVEDSLKKFVGAQHNQNGKAINVVFEHFEKDNAGWIKRILKFLDVDTSKELLDKIDMFLEGRKRFKRGRLHYDAALFGYNPKEIKMKFLFYAEFLQRLMSPVDKV